MGHAEADAHDNPAIELLGSASNNVPFMICLCIAFHSQALKNDCLPVKGLLWVHIA